MPRFSDVANASLRRKWLLSASFHVPLVRAVVYREPVSAWNFRSRIRTGRAVLGLVVIAVGLGILTETILYPELYPPSRRPFGSRPHWAFDIALLNVLLGIGLLLPLRARRRAEKAPVI